MKPRIGPALRVALEGQGLAPELPPGMYLHQLPQNLFDQLDDLPEAQTIAALAYLVLNDSKRERRIRALLQLARFTDPRADAALVLGLLDRRSGKTVQVARGLLLHRGDATLPLLLAVLTDHPLQATSIAELLAERAENTPSLALRAILPHLRPRFLPRFPFSSQPRALVRALERIEAATAHLKDLPLTAQALPNPESLPLPSVATSPAPTRPWWRFWG